MNRTILVSVQALPILVSGLLAGVGCMSAEDNEPSVNSGSTGDPSGGSSMGGTTSASGTTSTAGNTSTGGTPPNTGGSPSAGSAGTPAAGSAGDVGTGGTPTAGAGGSALGGAGSGGAPAAGTAGSAAGDVGTGGTPMAGAAGTPATGGSGPFTFPDGTCGETVAGEDIGKGVACTAEDVQVCDKTCGPANVGYKTETCTEATYAEGDCTFPSGANYACFALPDPLADAAACPTDAPPQHNEPCSLTICQTAAIGTACGQTTPCELCGVATGYLDSGGSSKTGYCVCITGASGGKWACGSTTAWPCPAGNGC